MHIEPFIHPWGPFDGTGLVCCRVSAYHWGILSARSAEEFSKRRACCRESGGKEHDRADGPGEREWRTRPPLDQVQRAHTVAKRVPYIATDGEGPGGWTIPAHVNGDSEHCELDSDLSWAAFSEISHVLRFAYFAYFISPFFFIASCFRRGFACVGTGVGDSPTTIRLHARHAQRALEQTSEASKTDNVELKAQVYLNHTSGHISQRWFQIARSCLAKGCDAINACSKSASDVRRNSWKKPRRVSRYYRSSLTWRLPILGH